MCPLGDLRGGGEEEKYINRDRDREMCTRNLESWVVIMIKVTVMATMMMYLL